MTDPRRTHGSRLGMPRLHPLAVPAPFRALARAGAAFLAELGLEINFEQEIGHTFGDPASERRTLLCVRLPVGRAELIALPCECEPDEWEAA